MKLRLPIQLRITTILGGCLVGGCAADHSPGVPTQASRRPAAIAADAPARDRPIALIDQQPVTMRDLESRLVEAAGGEVLRDLRLRAALAGRLAQENLVVTDVDVDAEEQRLLRELNDDEDIALTLLERVRRSEGLGPLRYRDLLWRNAALRLLIQPFVAVDDDAMRRVWEITYGPQVRTRVIVVNSYPRATAVTEAIARGDAFDRLAVEWSIDPSRDRGGLLDLLSTVDPAYPAALRDALIDLAPGETSPPILLGDRYVIARLEERIPAQLVTFDSVRDDLARRTRLAQERMLMQEEAVRLRNEPELRIFDERLDTSFRDSQLEMDQP